MSLSLLQAQETEKPADKPADKPSEFKTVKERVSYGIGMDFGFNMARTLKAQEVDADVSAILKGVEDALKGKDSRVPEAEMQAALKEFQKEFAAKAKKRLAEMKKLRDEQAKKQVEANPELKAVSDKNIKEGAEFLKANKAKQGVKTTASGLQYEVLKKGTGKKPTEDDIVTTHYHGTLPGGKVFDSTEGQEPASFPVGRVIDGWTEALQMMPVGSKWRLVVPANLAYGWSGSGEDIGPNQVLVFEVELVSIESDSEETPQNP